MTAAVMPPAERGAVGLLLEEEVVNPPPIPPGLDPGDGDGDGVREGRETSTVEEEEEATREIVGCIPAAEKA
jgi:hypothetical protein